MRRDHGGQHAVAIDASVNVNPLGPPEALDAVFARARKLASRYPELDASRARDAWASRLRVDRETLLVGNGASELISVAMRAIAPERVIVFDPSYSEYEAAARATGVPVLHVPLELDGDRWRAPDELSQPSSGDLVVFGRPNNPTGDLGPAADALDDLMARGVHVLADESFLALSDYGEIASLVPHVSERLTVVASLTKTYCVPGLRLGILVGDRRLVERISELRDPWSVNAIAAEAAIMLAKQDAYLARSRELVVAERGRLARTIGAIPGVRVTQGAAPFFLVELPASTTAATICAGMRERHIAVRDASTFPGLSDRWIRIGVRTPPENDRLISALKGVITAEEPR